MPIIFLTTDVQVNSEIQKNDQYSMLKYIVQNNASNLHIKYNNPVFVRL